MGPQRPVASDNPFFHRGPVRNPDYFVGRQGEMAQTLGLVRNAQSVSIVGPRRIGKTSLLFQVAAHLRAAGTPCVYLTGEGHEHSEPGQFYAHLAEELAEAAQAWAPPPEADPYRRLERLLRTVDAAGQVAVVLLDEFELLARNPSLGPHFFSALRGLATRFPLAFVSASQEPLITLTYARSDVLSSPFFNCFATLPLGLLAADEARTLITELAARQGLAWPDATVRALLGWAGPHPLFLQIAGYHTYEAVRAGQPAEAAAAVICARSWPDLLPHFQYAWQTLSEAERYALATLPAHPDAPLLDRLEGRCLVRREGGRYVYLSSAWRQFVRRQTVAQVLQSDTLLLDCACQAAFVGDQALHLTNIQFQVLAHLLACAGQPVSPRELEHAVWHEKYVEDPERVKTVIKQLRRALGPAGRQIVNRRGLGYLYRPEPSCRL